MFISEVLYQMPCKHFTLDIWRGGLTISYELDGTWGTLAVKRLV